MLTKKQRNLLIFINKKIRSTGVSPSYEEMKNSLNLKSKSGIHRLISALEERGFIKRLAHKARALEVIKLPENASAHDLFNSFTPSVIKGGLDKNASKSSKWGIFLLIFFAILREGFETVMFLTSASIQTGDFSYSGFFGALTLSLVLSLDLGLDLGLGLLVETFDFVFEGDFGAGEVFLEDEIKEK